MPFWSVWRPTKQHLPVDGQFGLDVPASGLDGGEAVVDDRRVGAVLGFYLPGGELADGDEVVGSVGDALFGLDLPLGRVDVPVRRQGVEGRDPLDVVG